MNRRKIGAPHQPAGAIEYRQGEGHVFPAWQCHVNRVGERAAEQRRIGRLSRRGRARTDGPAAAQWSFLFRDSGYMGPCTTCHRLRTQA
jgi:hypothetical protein